jgi:DNA-binding FrmR family transcriptional regulator
MSTKTQTKHPLGTSHAGEIPKLNRIRGQLEGVTRMIGEKRYCPDILVQLAAARAAIKSVEVGILSRHMHNCVQSSISTPDRAEQMIEELVKLFRKA